MDGGEEGGLNRQNKSNQKLNIYALPPPPPNPPTLPTPSPYAISEFELVCALWFKYEISSDVCHVDFSTEIYQTAAADMKLGLQLLHIAPPPLGDI